MAKIDESLPPKSEAAAVSSESEEKESSTTAIANNENSDSGENQTDADTKTSVATKTTTSEAASRDKTNGQAENNKTINVSSSTSGKDLEDTTAAATAKATTANDGAESAGTSIATTEEEANPSSKDENPPQKQDVPVPAARGDEEQSTPIISLEAGEERLVRGLCADDQQDDLAEEEVEAEDSGGVVENDRDTTNGAPNNPSSGRGPGAFRVTPRNRSAGDNNAGRQTPMSNTSSNDALRTNSSRGGESTDIDSELARLGIPMVEAELVNTHVESGVLTAESHLNETDNGGASTTASNLESEEADKVYQAERIPTVTVCGKEMTRSTATLVACVVALFAIVAVVVPVSITQTNKSSAENALGEINQEEAARQSRIVDEITSFAKGDISNPMYGQALQWMVGPENAQINPSIPGMDEGLMKQRFTMAMFYYATGGDSWHTKGNFLSEDHVCEWSTMVVCNDEEGNNEVKELQFGNNNLKGTLPQELLYLDKLTSLNLTGNSGLAGSLLPEIGEMASLEVLDLHDTKFVGTIPESFVNLRKLTHLDLHNNDLTRALAYNPPSTIASLKELRYLDLAKNLLNDEAPDELFRLTNLEYLDISENEIGNNGDFGYKLGYLMTSSIGAMVNLRVFSMANNNLGGPISPHLAKCKRLEELHLAGNDFIDGIPSEVGQLRELKVFDLSNNGDLGGSIPSVLGELSNLETLNLKNTGLAGTIPEELGRLMNMNALNLDVNYLTGSIPREIFNIANMKELRLASNSLEGTIPAEVGNAIGLTHLSLYENNLEGPLPPEIGNLVNLTSLVLVSNGLNSTLPETLGNLVNLKILIFDENFFTGELPTTLGNLENLEEIHGTRNGLNGKLPTELGRVRRKKVLPFYYVLHLTFVSLMALIK